MNRIKIKLLFPIILMGILLVQVGCVKESFDVVPELIDTSSLVPTATISQIKKFRDLSASINQVKKIATQTFWDSLLTATGDSAIVISGYVTSNDSAGNFYEVVTIQDHTGGIDIKINAKRLYATYRFKPGQRVLVKMNNLYVDFYRGTYQIGASMVDLGVLKIAGLDMKVLPNYIERSGRKKPVEPIDLTIEELNNSHVQKLVRINNVQFWDATKGYAVPTVNTNRNLVNCEGKMLILRTSGFASFAEQIVPSGNGSITGVLGKYDNTLQLVIRDPSDVQFPSERCGGIVPMPNTTLAQLRAMCTTNLQQITTNVVVEGVVAANDKSGNLFKQLFIQDETGGMEFKVDLAGLYVEFPVGTKIVVNCNGMWLGKYGGVVQLGGNYNNSIGRLEADKFYKNVYTIASGLAVDPIPVEINQITDALLGRLIVLNGVQFSNSELGLSWAPGAVTNRWLEDFWENRIIVRTSNYASFANNILPSKKGEFTAILSKFNADYQLYVRSLADVKLIEPRAVKEFLINENFATATVNQPIAINNWQSIAQVGSKVWIAKESSGNRYAEMTAYQSAEASNISWLVSPQVNLSTISPRYLTFKTQFSQWRDGTTLEVYIASNYDGQNPAAATWTKLNDAYIVQQADGFGVWMSSGIVNLQSFSGNVHFGFKYTGGGTTNQFTFFRVDDFQVFGGQN
jgi:hypothetical protein